MAYSLLGETFGEYAVAMCFLLLRLFARVKVAGVRNLGLGDFFAGMAMVFYSLTTAGIYLLEKYGNNIGLNDQTAMEVPASKVPSLVLGSKLAFMNWIWYLCFIWSLKGVLLSLYAKMATDFGIILIPMPLLFKVKVPLRHKLLLICLFGSGIFVMIATILRAYYSLRSISDLPIALGWADREEFVATIVVCLPGIKPLFNNKTWFKSSRLGSGRTPGNSQGYGKNISGSGGNSYNVSQNKEDSGKQFELGAVGWRRHPYGTKLLSSGASDEEVIIHNTHEDNKASDDARDIFVTQEYTVSSEDAQNKV
ncbi:MAG: hypothetical protein M1821_000072 [Bathelium mastoideum]|nr:MAG: hypothetical protein M1821_000072 [Bathelium mastoideum]